MKHEWGIYYEYDYDGYRVVVVNTNKATYWYRGHLYHWNEMGSFLRRKFENLLVMTRPKERLKIKYV